MGALYLRSPLKALSGAGGRVSYLFPVGFDFFWDLDLFFYFEYCLFFDIVNFFCFFLVPFFDGPCCVLLPPPRDAPPTAAHSGGGYPQGARGAGGGATAVQRVGGSAADGEDHRGGLGGSGPGVPTAFRCSPCVGEPTKNGGVSQTFQLTLRVWCASVRNCMWFG